MSHNTRTESLSAFATWGADHLIGDEKCEAQRFTLQSLMCLFAEDIGLLEKCFFARLLDDCATPATPGT